MPASQRIVPFPDLANADEDLAGELAAVRAEVARLREAVTPLAQVVRLGRLLLRLRARRRPPALNSPAPEPPDPAGQLVTLDQAAALVHRSKRTLDAYRELMPRPEVLGRRGRPSLWRWSVLRPWLTGEFGVLLPERYPAPRN